MTGFELWMFPLAAAGLVYVAHLIVMWRLRESDRRARALQATAAE